MVTPSRGQDDWVAALYAEQAPNLLRYLTARVGAAAAEDLTAETFIVALRRQVTFDPGRGSAAGWLFGIASNVLRQHHRSEARYLRAVTKAAGQQSLAEFGQWTAADDRVDAEAAVRRLIPQLLDMAPVDRDILLLTAWAGLGPTEVAQALGLRAAQVRSHLHRVRQKLRAGSPPQPSDLPDEIHSLTRTFPEGIHHV